jgi:hypothetical protein
LLKTMFRFCFLPRQCRSAQFCFLFHIFIPFSFHFHEKS